MYKTNNKAFTLVELIVVATILVILATMWFAAFWDSIPDARDAERKASVAQIQSALESYHSQRQVLPVPGNKFDITLTGSVVAQQWKFDNTVRINNALRNLPLDPYTDTPYSYSMTNNKQEFQVAATLENGDIPIAYLQWDYVSVSFDRLPTIMVAADANTEINAAPWRDLFVFNNLEYNLVYDLADPELPYFDGTDFSTMVADSNLNYWHKSDYRSCDEIRDAWKSIWNWPYQYLDSNGALQTYTCTWM